MARVRIALGVFILVSILLWNFVPDDHGARRDGIFTFVPAAIFAWKACGLPRDARLMWGILVPIIAAFCVLGFLVVSGSVRL
jgi:hypothetical protein